MEALALILLLLAAAPVFTQTSSGIVFASTASSIDLSASPGHYHVEARGPGAGYLYLDATCSRGCSGRLVFSLAGARLTAVFNATGVRGWARVDDPQGLAREMQSMGCEASVAGGVIHYRCPLRVFHLQPLVFSNLTGSLVYENRGGRVTIDYRGPGATCTQAVFRKLEGAAAINYWELEAPAPCLERVASGLHALGARVEPPGNQPGPGGALVLGAALAATVLGLAAGALLVHKLRAVIRNRVGGVAEKPRARDETFFDRLLPREPGMDSLTPSGSVPGGEDEAHTGREAGGRPRDTRQREEA